MNILLAEDCKANRDLLAGIIAKCSVHITIFLASDGADAWSIYQRENIDMVITDIEMPRMSGGELAMKIRARRDDVPILYTTAYPSRAIEAEKRDIYIKPLNISKLKRRIKKMLGKKETDE